MFPLQGDYSKNKHWYLLINYLKKAKLLSLSRVTNADIP